MQAGIWSQGEIIYVEELFTSKIETKEGDDNHYLQLIPIQK